MNAYPSEKRARSVETRLTYVEGDVRTLKTDVTLLKRFQRRAETRFREFSRFKDHVYGMIDEIAISLDQMTWHAVRLRQGVGQYHAAAPGK